MNTYLAEYTSQTDSMEDTDILEQVLSINPLSDSGWTLPKGHRTQVSLSIHPRLTTVKALTFLSKS